MSKDLNIDNCANSPKLHNTVENFRSGKLGLAVHNWQALTSDKWILETITGQLAELVDLEVIGNTPYVLPLPPNDQAALEIALNEFLETGIIEPCTHSPGSHYSSLFPRYKTDNSVRVIFNLKSFNEQYIDPVHFKMETIKDVLLLVHPGCFFASVDFKHAYFSVPMGKSLRKYFRFQWNNQLFQFTCLPQGLSPAPRIFTKLLKPALSHLRARGIQVVCYIDDCIFIADNKADLQRGVYYAVELFDSLGLTVHPTKSQLTPVQSIEFLGFLLDSNSMLISLTDLKREKICGLAKSLLTPTKHTIRDLASFIGNLVAADPAVPLGPLHYKFLEIERNEQLSLHKGDYEAFITLSERAQEMLQWWLTNIPTLNRPVIQPPPTCEIFTDASLLGWGARMGSIKIGGQWAKSELCHINLLELKAVFLAIQTLCRNTYPAHVKIRSDNSTTVACINKAGSTKPDLHTLTVQLLSWTHSRGIHLSAAHIPGVENIDADRESRRVNHDAEWQLLPSLFRRLCIHFDFVPSIDLFATRINAQMSRYVSWKPDPTATDIDAFSLEWTNMTPYIFPPFSVIGRILRQIKTDGIRALVILPLWPTKPWFVEALSMVAAPPVLLPRHCLQLPQLPDKRHPLYYKLKLAALILSGDLTEIREFQGTLPIFCSSPGDREPGHNIATLSRNGCYFVTNGKLLRFFHL